MPSSTLSKDFRNLVVSEMAKTKKRQTLLEKRRFAYYLLAKNAGRCALLEILQDGSFFKKGLNAELISLVQDVELRVAAKIKSPGDDLHLAEMWGMWEIAVKIHQLLHSHGLMDDPLNQIIAMHHLYRMLANDQVEPTI